jgi:hypothetical protein
MACTRVSEVVSLHGVKHVAAAQSLSVSLAEGEAPYSSLRSGDPFSIASASKEAAVHR